MPAEPPNTPSNPFSRASPWPAANRAGLRITPMPDMNPSPPAAAPQERPVRAPRPSIITGSAIPGVALPVRRATAEPVAAAALAQTQVQSQAQAQAQAPPVMAEPAAAQAAVAPRPSAAASAPAMAAAPQASSHARPATPAPEWPVFVRKRKRRNRMRGVIAYGGGVALVVFAICIVISVIGRHAAISDGVIAAAKAPVQAPAELPSIPDSTIDTVETADGALRGAAAEPRISIARVNPKPRPAHAAARRPANLPAAGLAAGASPLQEMESSMSGDAAPAESAATEPAQAAPPPVLAIPAPTPAP